MIPWRVERRRGRARDLHARSAASVASTATGVVRTIRLLDATDRAVVLGSGQPAAHVDAERAAALGIDVCRRRSGGSAVLVGPDDGLWVDLVVPAGDPLWSDDVVRAAGWVGELWVAALADAGVPAARAWRGPLRPGPWSDRVCFAGLGPGEVVVPGRGGAPAKVVGVAQRRTRAGAVFQCAVPVVWAPEDLLAVLDLDGVERRRAAVELAPVAVGLGAAARSVVEALVARAAAGEAARVGGQLP